jgi:hypothetical protein
MLTRAACAMIDATGRKPSQRQVTKTKGETRVIYMVRENGVSAAGNPALGTYRV